VRRLTIALLLALLAGCGSKGEGDGGESGKSGGRVPPAKGDLSDLDGMPIEELLRAIVPRLAQEPGYQNPAQLAESLDKNWEIHCEQICRIKRK
jgi:hypothetical protein